MTLADGLRTAVLALERGWDRHASRSAGAPTRFEAYLGHGDGSRVVVRGRLLRGAAPTGAQPGEHVAVTLRRTLRSFATIEVPREEVRVQVGRADAVGVTDDEGYLEMVLEPGLDPEGEPWRAGTVSVTGGSTPVAVRVPRPAAGFGVISDLDDTIIDSRVQQPLRMLARTLTGSALTRRTFAGAPELYRSLAVGPEGAPDSEVRPFFYVSSSPWNLHAFLVGFLDHQRFPRGPLLLRDLLGSGGRHSHRETKRRAIEEVLGLHPTLRFVLIGDSGELDAPIYAEVVREHPGRVLAVYLHEVRDRPGGVVDETLASWPADVPVLLTRDFGEMARDALELGLVLPLPEP